MAAAEQRSLFPQQLTPAPPGGSPGAPRHTGKLDPSRVSWVWDPRGFLPAGHARGGTGVSSLSRRVSLSSLWRKPISAACTSILLLSPRRAYMQGCSGETVPRQTHPKLKALASGNSQIVLSSYHNVHYI